MSDQPPLLQSRLATERQTGCLDQSRQDGQIEKFHLERALEPRDIEKLAETASWLRKSTQTLRNWTKNNPAFPLETMGGHWVVIRPFLDAYLLHEWL